MTANAPSPACSVDSPSRRWLRGECPGQQGEYFCVLAGGGRAMFIATGFSPGCGAADAGGCAVARRLIRQQEVMPSCRAMMALQSVWLASRTPHPWDEAAMGAVLGLCRAGTTAGPSRGREGDRKRMVSDTTAGMGMGRHMAVCQTAFVSCSCHHYPPSVNKKSRLSLQSSH